VFSIIEEDYSMLPDGLPRIGGYGYFVLEKFGTKMPI